MKKYIFLALIALLPVMDMAALQGAPPATPIDGGLSILLVAGGLFGAKKLRDHYKE